MMSPGYAHAALALRREDQHMANVFSCLVRTLAKMVHSGRRIRADVGFRYGDKLRAVMCQSSY